MLQKSSAQKAFCAEGVPQNGSYLRALGGYFASTRPYRYSICILFVGKREGWFGWENSMITPIERGGGKI